MATKLDLNKYLPAKFNSPLARGFVDACGEMFGRWHDRIVSVGDMMDIDQIPDAYLTALANTLGWPLEEKDMTVVGDRRRMVRELVALYRIKGTYRSLQSVLYSVGIPSKVFDLYSTVHRQTITSTADGKIGNTVLTDSPLIPGSIRMTDGDVTVFDVPINGTSGKLMRKSIQVGTVNYNSRLVAVTEGSTFAASTTIHVTHGPYNGLVFYRDPGNPGYSDSVEPWFVGTYEEELAFPAYPDRFKTPHFNVLLYIGQVCFLDDQVTKIFYQHQFDRLSRMVDYIKPINTVPHYECQIDAEITPDDSVYESGCHLQFIGSIALGDALRSELFLFDMNGSRTNESLGETDADGKIDGVSFFKNLKPGSVVLTDGSKYVTDRRSSISDEVGELVYDIPVSSESIGSSESDGTLLEKTLDHHPVEPGSIVLSDGTNTLLDNGSGRLTKSGIAVGLINYAAGTVSVQGIGALENSTSVSVDYLRYNYQVVGSINWTTGAISVTEADVLAPLVEINSSYDFWLRRCDTGYVFDWGDGAALSTLTRWKMGTAHTGTLGTMDFNPSGTVLHNDSGTPTGYVADSIISTRVLRFGRKYQVSVYIPAPAAAVGITSFKLWSPDAPDRFIQAVFPPCDKIVEVPLTINVSLSV